LNQLLDDENTGLSIDQTDYCFCWGTGFTYKIKYNKNRDIQFGLAYESNVEFMKTFSYNGNNTFIIDSSNTTFNYIYQSYLLKGNLPGELKFDVDINSLSNINFLCSVNYVFWNDVGNNLENQLEFSGNIIYLPSSVISPSLGLYVTGRKYKDDIFDINDKMTGIFFTAGLKINFNYFDLDLAIADGNLLSGEAYKQTIGKLGAGFHL
jgi:long-subunit fatty acid transport protein